MILTSLINSLGLPGIGMQNGVIIPFSSEVVSIGVTLDSKLTLRIRLVESLVQPHLDYCSVVYLDATKEQRTRLDRLSNTGVRYIFGVRRDTHITPYWRRLGWLRSDSRRLYFTALLLYKIRRMREPTYLADLFKEYNLPAGAFSRNLHFLL